MPRLIALWLTLAAWLALAGPAQAGTITITTTVKAIVTGDHLRVEITLVNQGDEAARNLSLEMEAAGVKLEAPGPESLPPNQPYQTSLELDLKLTTPGTYPVVILVRFHDLNGYPFSSLAQGLFAWQAPTYGQVMAKGLPSLISGEGTISFELANADQAAHQVAVRVVAPQELSLDNPSHTLTLAGRAKATLGVTARNFSALQGATYPVLVVMEYETGGKHYSAVAVAPVAVGAPPSMVQRLAPYLYAAAGLMVAALVWLQLRRRRSPGSGS